MTRNLAYPDTKGLAAWTDTRQLLIKRKASQMKRTEKVEIRVSLEEKQTLAQLASQEGESVSGLIRGLVEKYMALNTASTVRRLPKSQIALGLVTAAFIGHALTLLPMHLHKRGHLSSETEIARYMVHGAVDDSAFGVGVHKNDPTKDFILNRQTKSPVQIKLSFKDLSDEGGTLGLLICELGTDGLCENAFETKMDIDRIDPSVLGASTKSGKPIHIFVQEMA